MKMLWITCNESVAEEVMEILDREGVSGYSVIQNVLNRDHKKGRTAYPVLPFSSCARHGVTS